MRASVPTAQGGFSQKRTEHKTEGSMEAFNLEIKALSTERELSKGGTGHPSSRAAALVSHDRLIAVGVSHFNAQATFILE